MTTNEIEDGNARCDIRCAMIDIRGALRCGGHACFLIPAMTNLSALVGGWLPEGCTRDENNKIVVSAS